MAIYDLEEQEQIDTLKQFWRDYGKLIILACPQRPAQKPRPPG